MEKTRLQQYQELQSLIKKDAADVARQVFKEMAPQFGVNKTATHQHNGVDSVQIESVNLLPNNKYLYGINANGGGTTEVVQIRVIPNMQQVLLNGFAANNLSAPATKRATINGNAAFGRTFVFSAPGSTVTTDSPIVGVPLVQSSTSLMVSSATLGSQRVGFSTEHIVYVLDETGAEVATMTIDSYQNGTMQLTVTLATDWQIFFSLTIS